MNPEDGAENYKDNQKCTSGTCERNDSARQEVIFRMPENPSVTEERCNTGDSGEEQNDDAELHGSEKRHPSEFFPQNHEQNDVV